MTEEWDVETSDKIEWKGFSENKTVSIIKK